MPNHVWPSLGPWARPRALGPRLGQTWLGMPGHGHGSAKQAWGSDKRWCHGIRRKQEPGSLFPQFTNSHNGQCHLFPQLRIFHIHTVEIFHIHTIENVQCSQKRSDRFSDRFWTKIGLFPSGPGKVPGTFLDNGKGFPRISWAVSDNFFGLFRKLFGKVSR